MSDYYLVFKAKVIFTVNDFTVEDDIQIQSTDFELAFNEWRIVLREYNPFLSKNSKYLAVSLHRCYVGPTDLSKGEFQPFIIDSDLKQRFLRKKDINVSHFGTTVVCPLISLTLLMKSESTLFPDNKLKIGAYIALYLRTSHLENSFDYRNSFNVEEVSDLKIICGQKVFFVSKDRLVLQSNVFRGMFSSGMREQLMSRLVVEDINEEVFEEFLKFIYFYNSDKLEEFKEELLYLSDKYEVLNLKTICEELIFMDINHKNAIKILRTFDKFNCFEMKNKTMDFVVRNMSSVRSQSPNDMMDVIKSDDQLTDQIIKAMSHIIESEVIQSYEPTSLQSFDYKYISY